MPGVPGRGCVACRKAKKKCDQLTPTCSRCKRLQLACIGPGAQRYKFLEQRFENESEEIQSPEQENSSVALIRRPSNPLLLMTSSFIEKLEVTDLRYDLTWTYGGFLKHIPKRLGTNEALDSAVGAVTGAFPTLYTGQISRGALTSYGDGLKALRVCLDDPSKAQTAETLCAIYLMIICQSMLGLKDETNISHGEGISKILSVAAIQDMSDTFASEMVITACAIVILESIGNPRIRLDDWLPNVLGAHLHQIPQPTRDRKPTTDTEQDDDHDDGGPIHSLTLPSIARLPYFIRQPELYIADVQSFYETSQVDVRKLRKRMIAVTNLSLQDKTPNLTPPEMIMRMYAHYQASLALALTLGIMYNYILRTADPSNATLSDESLQLANQLLAIGMAVAPLKPLGASYMLALTPIAWAATTDVLMKANLHKMIYEFSTIYPGVDYSRSMGWLQDGVDKLQLRIQQHYKAF